MIDDEGRRPLLRVAIAEPDGEPLRTEPRFERVVDGELQIASPGVDRSGHLLVYGLDSPTRPPEIFLRRLRGAAEEAGEGEALTRENGPLLARVDLTQPEPFWFDLHGEDDHDVPIEQAEEMYMALAKQGVPTALVRYPGEGHGIRGPRHRLDFYRRVLEWLERWVRGEGSAPGDGS